jgi:hypothetical protein
MVPMWVLLVHPSPIQLQLERNQILIIKGKMHFFKMENERERNEKWVVKFLQEMHEMKNEREREREMKIGL